MKRKFLATMLAATIGVPTGMSKLETAASTIPSSFNSPVPIQNEYFLKTAEKSYNTSMADFLDQKNISYEKMKMADSHPMPAYDIIPEKIETTHIAKNHCAQYAKFSSKKDYGKEFPKGWEDGHNKGHSWNLRYNTITNELKPGNLYSQLDSLREERILEPGMILGAHFPGSKYNNAKDMKGNKAKYTHTLVYRGKNEEGQFVLDHLWGQKIQRITSDNFSDNKYNLTAIEILDVKPEDSIDYFEAHDELLATNNEQTPHQNI